MLFQVSKKSILENHCEIEQENQSRNDHKPHTVKSSNNDIKIKEENRENAKTIFCMECDKQFYDNHKLMEHKNLVHPKTPKYTCLKCENRFVYKGSLIRHLKDLHNVSSTFLIK